MTSLDMFVHQENLALFKKQLADPETTDAERELLLKLLQKRKRRTFGTRTAVGRQGTDRRQSFSRNRTGQTANLGFDGLCARQAAAA